MSMLISGCATNGETPALVVIDTGCDWTKYIYLTDHDIDVMSPSAKRQILTHNETRESQCKDADK